MTKKTKTFVLVWDEQILTEHFVVNNNENNIIIHHSSEKNSGHSKILRRSRRQQPKKKKKTFSLMNYNNRYTCARDTIFHFQFSVQTSLL